VRIKEGWIDCWWGFDVAGGGKKQVNQRLKCRVGTEETSTDVELASLQGTYVLQAREKIYLPVPNSSCSILINDSNHE